MGINKTRLAVVVGLLLTTILGGGAYIAWKRNKRERADALFANVRTFLESKQFDKAKIESEKLVRIASQDANAQFLRAQALLAGRDPTVLRTTDPDGLSAIKALLGAVRVDRSLIDAQRMIVAYYVGQRNYTEAMQHAQEILQKTPEDVESNYVIARALVQLNRPLDARPHLERLLANEKDKLRPRTAALAAAVGDGLGREGEPFRVRAGESLAGYVKGNAKFEALDDRISLVELRCWKAHRTNAPAPVVKEHLLAAVAELGALVEAQRTNDMLPGFVLDAVGQLLPDRKTWSAELKPIFTEVHAATEKVTAEAFNSAIANKILDARVYTAYAERLREAGDEAKAVATVEKGLENAKVAAENRSNAELIKREFGSCNLWLAKHFLATKRTKDAKPQIDALQALVDWKPWGDLMLGYSLVIEDRFDDAIPPLREAVKRLGESNGAAHALYGLCMLRRGYVTLGREHLEKGKALGADGPQFKAWLTLALAEAGEANAALRLAQEILGDERTNGIGKALQGELYLRTGDLKRAEVALAASLQTADPKIRPAIRLSQAQLAMAKKDWNGAKAIFDEVKQDKNYAYRAYAIESRFYQQTQQADKAKATLDEGRRQFPDNNLLLALQIGDLTSAGRYDDARQVLSDERQRNPNREQPYLLLSEVFDTAKKPDQAISVLEDAAKQFPKEASIRMRLADKLISRSRTAEVGPILAGLEGDPNVNPSSIAYLRARMASTDGQPEKAKEIIRDAFKQDKYNPALRHLMAQLLAREGDLTGSRALLSSDDGRASNKQSLAFQFDLALAEGQLEQASQLLRQAEISGPIEGVAPLRRRLMRLLAQQDRGPEVVTEVEALLASRPTEADLAAAVGVLQGVGKTDMARKIVSDAIARSPNSDVLNEVDIAMMLDAKQYQAAQAKISELLSKPSFQKNPTMYVLRARGLLGTAEANSSKAEEEISSALKTVELGLDASRCGGHPTLVAMKIQLLLRLGRESEAESYATTIVRQTKNLPPAKYFLARAFEAIGKIDKAFALLAELTSSDPSDANAAHHYLRLLISRGQFGDLEPSIERFIAANADKSGKRESALLLGILGEYHATRGDAAKADAVLKRIERIPDAGVVAPYLRGVVAFAQGNLDNAEKALRLAMTDPTGHIPSTFLMAQIRAQQAKYDEALKLLTRIARSPESPAAVPLLRANLLRRLDRSAEAEAACRDYLRMNPSARPFQQLLVQILLDRNNDVARAEALQIAETALEKGVDNPLDFEVFLRVLFTSNKAEKALRLITERAVNKGQMELLLAGGRACYAAELYRDAERYARKLATDEPNHLNAKLLLGDCQMKLGAEMDPKLELERNNRFDDAAKQYREVLQLQPGNVIAANNLAWIYGVHLGKPHRAIEELRAALGSNLQPTNKSLPAEVLDTVGVIHTQMDHFSDAQAYLEEAANRKPTSAEIQLHLGELYLKQERPDLAKNCFEKARKLDAKRKFANKLAEYERR